MSGLTKMSTATYSTKRQPAASSGKGGVSATHLTGLASVPIMPAQTAQASINPLGIKDPLTGQMLELLETYIEYQEHVDSTVTVTQLPDIRENDVLVSGSTNYRIRRVSSWPATANLLAYLHIVLEATH
jgi:hypothetical protein